MLQLEVYSIIIPVFECKIKINWLVVLSCCSGQAEDLNLLILNHVFVLKFNFEIDS